MIAFNNFDTIYSKNSKTYFNKYINNIQTPSIRYVTELAFSRVNEAFWHAPASSTGKYHPLYSLGDSGLARHTIAAVHFLERWFIAYDFNQIQKDAMTAALLLHDTCKSGVKFENQYTVFEHPILVNTLISIDELNNVEQAKAWSFICRLINPHMGRWNVPSQRDMQHNLARIISAFSVYRGMEINADMPNLMQLISLPTPQVLEEQIIANCDYTASDKVCMLTIFDDDKGAWSGISR